jgi:hypothetical protein
MITYHPHTKEFIILVFWYLRFLENHNINSKCSNFKSQILDVNGSSCVWHMNQVVAYDTKN